MQRIIQSVAPMRDMFYKRACAKFLQQQKGRGVEIDDAGTVETLGEARTVVLDTALVLEGDERVRCACAPLAPCPAERLKKQPSWMMLTAAVALGCAEYAPLERFAQEMSFAPERMARQYPLVKRFAYDEERCVETTLHREGGALRAYTKGAPASVLALCDAVQEGKARALTDGDRDRALDAAALMEREGLTALAFATKTLADGEEIAESGMTFLGMVARWGCAKRRSGAVCAHARRIDAAGAHDPGFAPEGLLRATGLVRPQAGILTGDAIALLDAEGLIEACDACDAFIAADERQRKRVASALRAAGRSSVLAIGDAACGDASVSFHGGAASVSIQGGPEMLASLLRGCRSFWRKMAKFPRINSNHVGFAGNKTRMEKIYTGLF